MAAITWSPKLRVTTGKRVIGVNHVFGANEPVQPI